MNMVDYKHEFDQLTSKLLQEYMKLETQYLQEKHNSVTNLSDINSKNTSICEAMQSKTDEIYGLEQEVEGLRLKEQEYILITNNLRSDLEKKKEIQEEGSKFDIIRGLSKEITAKDKEIERLTKMNEQYTKEISSLKDLKHGLTMVLEEGGSITETDVTGGPVDGWSPTTSQTPKTPDVEEQEEYFEISYRKKKYYRDSQQKVYEIVEGDEVGPCIGEWVKQGKGKFKLVKS